MSWDTPDTYGQPEKFGLEIVGDISWDDEPYQFDFTVVWKDPKTGEMFYARDSGCSCPSPFEEYTSREKLTPIESFQSFSDMITKSVEEAKKDTYYRSETDKNRVEASALELLQKVRAAQQ
jgi:hypothetical protein